jgi:hypothetical protein
MIAHEEGDGPDQLDSDISRQLEQDTGGEQPNTVLHRCRFLEAETH